MRGYERAEAEEKEGKEVLWIERRRMMRQEERKGRDNYEERERERKRNKRRRGKKGKGDEKEMIKEWMI